MDLYPTTPYSGLPFTGEYTPSGSPLYESESQDQNGLVARTNDASLDAIQQFSEPLPELFSEDLHWHSPLLDESFEPFQKESDSVSTSLEAASRSSLSDQELIHQERYFTFLSSPSMIIRSAHSHFDWTDKNIYRDLALQLLKNSKNVKPLLGLGYSNYNGNIPFHADPDALILDINAKGRLTRMANQLVRLYCQQLSGDEEDQHKVLNFFAENSDFTAIILLPALMSCGVVLRSPIKIECSALRAMAQTSKEPAFHNSIEYMVVLTPLSQPNFPVAVVHLLFYAGMKGPICAIRNLEILDPYETQQGYGALLMSCVYTIADRMKSVEIICSPSVNNLPFLIAIGFRPWNCDSNDWQSFCETEKLYRAQSAGFVTLSMTPQTLSNHYNFVRETVFQQGLDHN